MCRQLTVTVQIDDVTVNSALRYHQFSLSFDQKTYSGADPSFFRIYRGDWGVDAVRSSVAGIDRVTRLELAASGPLLGRLLDGSQELIDVSAVPWYRRDSFLP